MTVVLFRTPAAGDEYVPALSLAGYTSVSVPALAETFLADELRGVLARGAGEWEAAVVTSRRAAEAWVLAARDLAQDTDGAAEPWSHVTVYSPGGAVRTVLDAADLPPNLCPPHSVTATCAAELAPIILAAEPRPRGNGTAASAPHPSATPPTSSAPEPSSRPLAVPASAPASAYRAYLVLTGDKTLPLLTDTLRGAGRDVRRVRVYETREAEGLGEAVRELRPRLRSAEATPWAAIFSPSSGGFVLPHLEAAGYAVRAGAGGDATANPELAPLRIVAIGATTESALRQAGWRVDAVAATPDAPGLVAAIAAVDAADAQGAHHQ